MIEQIQIKDENENTTTVKVYMCICIFDLYFYFFSALSPLPAAACLRGGVDTMDHRVEQSR